jgi:NADP-dependent 3-hydroxy acid dehydrogenase YdfG
MIPMCLAISSYPAASAVAQLKSYIAPKAFIITAAMRMKMIWTNVRLVKILLNKVI